MAHPTIENTLPLVFEPLFLADTEGRPALVGVVKGTYVMPPARGALTPAEEQTPLLVEPEHWGDPDASSLRYEAEVSLPKPATDVVLIADAHPPTKGLREFAAGVAVGELRAAARVVGPRVWYRQLGRTRSTDPQPIEAPIPLIAENAFGGWDRSDEDPDRHVFEPRNPVGMGFHARGQGVEEGARLPLLEHPDEPVKSHEGRSAPALFGFSLPGWEPRRALAGTYDEAWARERSPLLPEDFDVRFLNAAPPWLVAGGHLQGDETVRILNASPVPERTFELPGEPPPSMSVVLRDGRRTDADMALDTIVLDALESRVWLLWRALVPLRSGPLDVDVVRVTGAGR